MSSVFAPSPAIRPRLDEARGAADSGDLVRAEQLLRDLLSIDDRPGSFDRLFVLSSLMTVYSRLGRQHETLVLARHLTDRLLELNQLGAAAGCMATYCEAISEVGSPEMRTRRLEELNTMLLALDPDEGGMPREAYHSCAFDLELRAGNLERARHHAERYRAYRPRQEGRPWRKASQLGILDIKLDLAGGMPRRALETLRRVEELVRRAAEPAAIVAWMRVQCLQAAGELSRAESAARSYLALLEKTRADEAMAPHRVRNAAALAAWFAARPGYGGAARRTYDLAAAAVIQRITQLSTAVPELEAIGVEVGTAADDLAELRRGFLAEQEDLLARVAQLFRSQPDAVAPVVVTEEQDAELVHLCAWCERVRTPEGVWLPIGHFIPRVGPLPISHGICGDCLAREQFV